MKSKRTVVVPAVVLGLIALILAGCENTLLESIETDIAEATTSLEPGFDIQYNGMSIGAGETVDVQNAGRNQTVTHSFSIRNTGDGELSLVGSPKVALVDDDGTGFFEFSSNQPPSPIRGGGSADFTVDFTPNTVGSDYTATMTIETDAAGAASFTFTIRTDAYESDLTAPTGAVSIAGDDAYATSRTVDLDISATDAGGSALYQMQLSNESSFAGATWEAYATSKVWMLPDSDGSNTVYARFRDGAGNESLAYSDDITLDRDAPSGYIQINGLDEYASDNQVTLSIVGNDSVSGVQDIQVSNSSVLNGASWQSYTSTISNHQTTANDGVKRVYLRIRDAAGNESPIFNDSIIVDTRAPIPEYVTIQYGYDYDDSSNVNVAFRADDYGGGPIDYMLWNDPSFSGAIWRTYSLGAPYNENAFPSPPRWDLEPGYGERTVYIKFRDAFADDLGSSHESDYITDTIIIDDSYEGTSGNNTTSEARSIEPQGWDPSLPTDINFIDQAMQGEARQYDRDYYSFTIDDTQPYSQIIVTATETTAADGETAAFDGSMTVDLLLPGTGSLWAPITAGGSGVVDYDPTGWLPPGEYMIQVSGGGNSTGYVIDVDFRDYQG